jgi:4a-hydroxytetrahydrobiopterin dehydratase
MDHHPDWSNSWNKVTIDIVSHAAGGITDQCVELAEKINSVV